MNKLSQAHPEKLLDLLTERLTFERASVKLYDRVLAKMKGVSDPIISGMVEQVTKQRNEEKDHEEWLEEQVRTLGSDAHTETERSELIERESKGIVDVIMQDDALPHLFHALLTAELVDDNGWKLLLQLADEAEDDVARTELRRRAEEEERHLVYVREVVAAFTRQEVLGKQVRIQPPL